LPIEEEGTLKLKPANCLGHFRVYQAVYHAESAARQYSPGALAQLSGCDCGRTRRFRDFNDSPVYFIVGFFFQCEICLGNNTNESVLAIHDGNSSDLVFLHKAPTTVDVLSIAARYRAVGDEFLESRRLGIQTARQNRTAKIAIGDHAYKCAGLRICNHRNGTGVLVTHHPATLRALSFAVQHVGFALMISLTFIFPSWQVESAGS
jgi:hypothetical protein